MNPLEAFGVMSAVVLVAIGTIKAIAYCQDIRWDIDRTRIETE